MISQYFRKSCNSDIYENIENKTTEQCFIACSLQAAAFRSARNEGYLSLMTNCLIQSVSLLEKRCQCLGLSFLTLLKGLLYNHVPATVTSIHCLLFLSYGVQPLSSLAMLG